MNIVKFSFTGTHLLRRECIAYGENDRGWIQHYQLQRKFKYGHLADSNRGRARVLSWFPLSHQNFFSLCRYLVTLWGPGSWRNLFSPYFQYLILPSTLHLLRGLKWSPPHSFWFLRVIPSFLQPFATVPHPTLSPWDGAISPWGCRCLVTEPGAQLPCLWGLSVLEHQFLQLSRYQTV